MENTPHKNILLLAQVEAWALFLRNCKERKKNDTAKTLSHVYLGTNPAEQNTKNQSPSQSSSKAHTKLISWPSQQPIQRSKGTWGTSSRVVLCAHSICSNPAAAGPGCSPSLAPTLSHSPAHPSFYRNVTNRSRSPEHFPRPRPLAGSAIRSNSPSQAVLCTQCHHQVGSAFQMALSWRGELVTLSQSCTGVLKELLHPEIVPAGQMSPSPWPRPSAASTNR